jgi:phage terminase large subunit-like protein
MIKSRGPLLRSLTSGSKLSTRNDASSQKLVATNKGISNKLTNSNLVIRPMSVDKLQGYRFHTSTVDEWLSGDTRDDPILAIQQGAAKTGDYLLIATSSEGTVRDGIGDTIKMELKKKLRGEIYDPSTSIWYYKLDSIREIADPEMWLKANPNLGATVTYETYEKEVQVAEERPDKRSEVLAKRFGIPAEGFSYFFNYEETLPHPPQDFDGLECAMGCDLSQGDDFCAFTFLFPLGNSRFGVKTRAYVSSNKVAKLPEATKEKYKEFYGELSLIEMPKGVLDMEAVYDDLTTYIAEHQYNVISVGYDPYNSKYFIERWKMEYSAFYVDKVIQGARTESVPLGELKNLAEYRLLYFDQELMKFSMGNAITIEDNNGNRKLSKRRAIEKIDCVAALLDAWVSYTSHREVYSG